MGGARGSSESAAEEAVTQMSRRAVSQPDNPVPRVGRLNWGNARICSASEHDDYETGTWNVEWATPRSKRSAAILDRIGRHSPEIVCLTEADAGLLQDGHTIGACPDYGYGTSGDHRKVLLWSKEPWNCLDDIGDDKMPPGRYVSGVTRTSLGEVTVVGLCIPWSGIAGRCEIQRGT